MVEDGAFGSEAAGEAPDWADNAAAARRVRNAVILPDGTKPVPMGSGVIAGVLGCGGMANVYEIWNAQLEVHRAVKLLHPNYTQEQKQRFQTEIKICAKLHHPNIIEVHAVGAWNGLPYIEMELVRGETLEKTIAQRGALPLHVITAIGILVCRAIVHAHNQEYVIYGRTYHGVIHRDLKPSNVMIAADGQVKLMDFGIARPTDASIHTTDGAILGTMQYLSPEQLDGKEPDVRTDVYAIGCTLYEMITGVQAFPEANVSKLMLNKIRNNYKSLDRYEIRMPSRLRRLVHSCLAHEPDRRPPSAEVLLSELSRIHHGLTSASPEEVMRQWVHAQPGERVVVPARRDLRWLAVGAVVFGVALVLVAAVVAVRRAPVKEPARSVAQAPAALPAASPVVSAPGPDAGPAAAAPAAKPRPATGSSDLPARPSRTAAVPPPAALSPLDPLRVQYGSADLQTLFLAAAAKGDYRAALQVADSLPADVQQSPKVLLYRMRALEKAASQQAYRAFLGAATLVDGEIYLSRARMELAQGRFEQALPLAEKALVSPCQLLDDDERRREALYVRALCLTSVFDAAPSQGSLGKALDAWFEVKAQLKASPDHPYFRKAVEEMQRLRMPGAQ